MIAETKVCLSCSKTIRGRADKKFCNDYCRNTYNNRLKGNTNSYMRTINLNLSRNRRILESFLPGSRYMRSIPKHLLFSKGYRFKYFTHTYTNRKGHLFYCCYEYGYLLLEKDKVLVVRKKQPAEEV
jgi:predicted nucleic acid-binding Zn ribbon protein